MRAFPVDIHAPAQGAIARCCDAECPTHTISHEVKDNAQNSYPIYKEIRQNQVRTYLGSYVNFRFACIYYTIFVQAKQDIVYFLTSQKALYQRYAKLMEGFIVEHVILVVIHIAVFMLRSVILYGCVKAWADQQRQVYFLHIYYNTAQQTMQEVVSISSIARNNEEHGFLLHL